MVVGVGVVGDIVVGVDVVVASAAAADVVVVVVVVAGVVVVVGVVFGDNFGVDDACAVGIVVACELVLWAAFGVVVAPLILLIGGLATAATTAAADVIFEIADTDPDDDEGEGDADADEIPHT